MKKTILLLAATAFFVCTNNAEKNKDPKGDTLASKNAVRQNKSVLDSDDKDTVNISTDDSTVSKYSTGDLKRILKKDPELNPKVPTLPDICWGESLKVSDDYNCEACRDDFYALYAYFLRVKNEEAKYRQQRKILIELYRDINELFGRLNRGGTYYGHQYTRILGYAEYSISVYIYQAEYGAVKSYNIKRQKELYLKSLTQFIDDEVNNDPELPPGEKAEKIKDLVGNAKDIGRLITTHFYLKMAQDFQYSHY